MSIKIFHYSGVTYSVQTSSHSPSKHPTLAPYFVEGSQREGQSIFFPPKPFNSALLKLGFLDFLF